MNEFLAICQRTSNIPKNTRKQIDKEQCKNKKGKKFYGTKNLNSKKMAPVFF
jgi:hypothetical protein